MTEATPDLVARLRSRREFASLDGSRWYTTTGPDRDCAEAASELEALQADAERYRWLRTQDWFSGPLAVVAEPKKAIKLGHDSPSRERLDQFIDAAMRSPESAHLQDSAPPGYTSAQPTKPG